MLNSRRVLQAGFLALATGLAGVSGLAGCSQPYLGEGRPEFKTATIAGNVSYRERIAMAPGSVLDVQLLDITDRAKPILVAQFREVVSGEAPIQFSMLYDPESISPEARYGLVATLGLEGGAGGPSWRSAAPYAIVPSNRLDQVSLLLVMGRGVDLTPVGMTEAGMPSTGVRPVDRNQLSLPDAMRPATNP